VLLDLSQAKLPKPGNQPGETPGYSWPNPRFNDNGDGTVTDYLTGLMWTKNGNPYGQHTWNDAIDWCDAYVYAGHDDWRLPNFNELSSLVNYSKANNATWLNSTATPFSAVQAYDYWSSSSDADNSSSAWVVAMKLGSVYNYAKTVSHYVWPVRAGR